MGSTGLLGSTNLPGQHTSLLFGHIDASAVTASSVRLNFTVLISIMSFSCDPSGLAWNLNLLHLFSSTHLKERKTILFLLKFHGFVLPHNLLIVFD